MNMNMNMDMSTPSSAGMPAYATSMAPVSPMDMSGMSSTFSSSTRVTLWFATWTTTTPAAYFLTIAFLFFLGILNRFLGALKGQLDRKWQKQHASTTAFAASGEKPSSSGIRNHTRQWNRALRPQPVRLEEPHGQEAQPLSPAIQTQHAEYETDANPAAKTRTFWVANAPWSIKQDGISAALEFVRALISYILMLAVMTFNVGLLFAVTGSVLIGEMVFGRYTRGSASLVEDECHS